MKRIGIGLIVGLSLALLGFVIFDIALGEAMSLECSVTGKYYVPPVSNVSTDSDGHVSTDTSLEEYHVTVGRVDSSEAYDLNTSRLNFARLTNGQIVRIGARLGRWTHAVYLGAIEP